MTPYYGDAQVTLWHGDTLAVLRGMADASVHCVVTSPPYYGLRDYDEPGQYGLEASPAEYVAVMQTVFGEVRRVLAKDGVLWLNLGDSYVSKGGAGGRMAATGLETRLNDMPRPEAADPAKFGRWNRDWGLPDKNLLGMPWRVAFALQDDGWILRNRIVWNKTNPMPESVRDRLSCRTEEMFLFSRSRRYWFDLDVLREPLTYPGAADGSRTFGGKRKGLLGGTEATARRRGHNIYGQTGMTLQTNMQPTGSRHTSHDSTGRNPGDYWPIAHDPDDDLPTVWSLPTQPFTGAHFAVMPSRLADRCVRSGCRPGGSVLDPFCGTATTGLVALRYGCRFVGIDLSRKSLDLALRTRLAQGALVDDLEAEQC